MKTLFADDCKKLLALSLSVAMAASFAGSGESIGSATSKGGFLVDSVRIDRTATLFGGNRIQSASGTADIRMPAGEMVLDRNTSVQVFGDRAVVDSGKIQVRGRSASGFAADAGAVQVRFGSGSEGVVQRNGEVIEVGAFRGPVSVRNRAGVLIATLAPNTAMSFTPDSQAGAEASHRVSVEGKIVKIKKSNVYDRDTRVDEVFLLTAKDGKLYELLPCNAKRKDLSNVLEKVSISKNYKVSGTLEPDKKPNNPAAGVVAFCDAGALAVSAGAAGAAAVGGWVALATGAKIAIIGGIAAVAVGVPVAVANAGDSSTTAGSSISR
jgi:hypothetical protein